MCWSGCRQVGFGGSTQITWILASGLIWSTNHPSATLLVRDACLIVRLLPLVIILMTATLSSKMYNKAVWRDCLAFGGKNLSPPGCALLFRSTFGWILKWHTSASGSTETDACSASMIRSHRSNAGVPSILSPASRETVLPLCESTLTV